MSYDYAEVQRNINTAISNARNDLPLRSEATQAETIAYYSHLVRKTPVYYEISGEAGSIILFVLSGIFLFVGIYFKMPETISSSLWILVASGLSIYVYFFMPKKSSGKELNTAKNLEGLKSNELRKNRIPSPPNKTARLIATIVAAITYLLLIARWIFDIDPIEHDIETPVVICLLLFYLSVFWLIRGAIKQRRFSKYIKKGLSNINDMSPITQQ